MLRSALKRTSCPNGWACTWTRARQAVEVGRAQACSFLLQATCGQLGRSASPGRRLLQPASTLTGATSPRWAAGGAEPHTLPPAGRQIWARARAGGGARPGAPSCAGCGGLCRRLLLESGPACPLPGLPCLNLPCMPTPRPVGDDAPPAWPAQVRDVARHYGFRHVVTTHQLTRAMPAAVPFQ